MKVDAIKAEATRADAMRAAYPILRTLASEMAKRIKDRKPVYWCSCDDLCTRLNHFGVKENSRTVAAHLLKPLQAKCIEHGVPDLSSIIVLKPRARQDQSIKPLDWWWGAYVEGGECESGDINFWFARFKDARDYNWPEEPFFNDQS